MLERIEGIIRSFAQKKLKISVAESCTGGYISHMLTNISGASQVFDRGLVTYSNEAKIDLLKVNPNSIQKYGAVSEQVAKEMAEGILNQCNGDVGIGVTGIAGPTGGTSEKPIGLVYISIATKENISVDKYIFKTSRIDFKSKVLLKIVEKLESLTL